MIYVILFVYHKWNKFCNPVCSNSIERSNQSVKWTIGNNVKNVKNATTRTKAIKDWAELDLFRSEIFSNKNSHTTPENVKNRRENLLQMLNILKNLNVQDLHGIDMKKTLIDLIQEIQI